MQERTNQRRFLSSIHSRAVRQFIWSGMVFACIIITATIAYSCFGWNLADALYMTVITVFGIGYQEIQPVQTVGLRMLTMGVIMAGSAGVVYMVGSLVALITEGEIKRAMEDAKNIREIEQLKNHTIICGYGRIGQTLAKELDSEGFPLVVVETDDERIKQAAADGFPALKGDASQENLLQTAGIEQADHLAVVVPNDAISVFVTLTARNMNKTIRILARGENAGTGQKLIQAGANEVIMPSSIGAQRIAHSITKPSINSVIDDPTSFMFGELQSLGVELDEFKLRSGTHFVGQTLSEFLSGMESRFLVLGIKCADGDIVEQPDSNYELKANDRVIVLGHKGQLPQSVAGEVDTIILGMEDIRKLDI